MMSLQLILLCVVLTTFFFVQQQQLTIEKVQSLEQSTIEEGMEEVENLQQSKSGKGKTTRYWDCCKVSCAWKDNIPKNFSPVKSCNAKGQPIDANTMSVCAGGGNKGPAYVCPDQQPWTEGGIFYGFVAANKQCCSCYELEFTNTAVKGKKMQVQIINSGGDLGEHHFDIQIPGGGFGIFNGCTKTDSEPKNGAPMYPQTPKDNWGKRYGGPETKDGCKKLPEQLRKGCNWKFDDFKNADNPLVNWKKIDCPAKLTNKSGCKPK